MHLWNVSEGRTRRAFSGELVLQHNLILGLIVVGWHALSLRRACSSALCHALRKASERATPKLDCVEKLETRTRWFRVENFRDALNQLLNGSSVDLSPFAVLDWNSTKLGNAIESR